ncbi:MAG TPA: VWA domain-containing protein, partial [Candidatus Binataceae bacterium]|nr:VWA domain-containing protein [Candidatus Binataceae bacterium]
FHSFSWHELNSIQLVQPQALYLFAPAALLLAYWLWRAGNIRRAAAPLLRALALSLFILALADPRVIVRSEGTTRPVLIDASGSITPAMRDYTVSLLRDRLKYHPQDPAFIFGGTVVQRSFADVTSTMLQNDGCEECAPSVTNLEAALEKISADLAAHGGNVVLVTDGWQNRGDATNALSALRAAGIQLDIFTPPGAEAVHNISMNELNLPPALEKAEPFALSVTMTNLNSSAAGGTISLYRNGGLVERRAVTLAPGQSRYDFPVRAEESGLISYRAEFKPANPALDVYPEDNSLQGWVGIGAQRKILILSDSARDANYLTTVVRRIGFQPSVLVLNGREYAGNPQGYDAVILNNVPRAQLAPAAQNALVRYVTGGGALAMVGGDQSFGLGGYENSALARIMPVVMKPPQHRMRTRALVLIIDKSGSMGRHDKLAYAKMAAQTVLKTLKDNDLVSVIGFDVQPFVVVPLEPLAQVRPYFDQLINRLKAQGRTYLLPALEEAARTLQQSNAAIKHVVILTDGETGGTPEMYYDLVSTMRHQGDSTISAIAIGREANLPLLQAIAKYGGGGFYQTDSPENLPELFVDDVAQRSADTTMVEKEFVPYGVRPDPVLRELAGRQLPALKGFVATALKPGADLSLFVNSNGQRHPIIASWKAGAGKTLAVTTDASGRWSSLWVQDGVFEPLWDRLLGWLAPHNTAVQNFAVALGYRSGRIQLNLTDYDTNSRLSNSPVTANVTAPDGAKYSVALSREAPGELSGRIEAPRAGTYNIELTSRRAEQKFPPLAYTVSPAIYAELPRPAPNYALLEQLAAATDGKLNPASSEIRVSRPHFEQSTSLNSWLILCAMVLTIVEALFRRLTF